MQYLPEMPVIGLSLLLSVLTIWDGFVPEAVINGTQSAVGCHSYTHLFST